MLNLELLIVLFSTDILLTEIFEASDAPYKSVITSDALNFVVNILVIQYCVYYEI